MAGMSTVHQSEVDRGERFRFGENWAGFLETLDRDRLRAAIHSLREMLEVESLDDKLFLDAGSGSGLFSLAARKLGARVVSFDFDPASVACTAELRQRHMPDDDAWVVHEGSVLDSEFVAALPAADIVYAWGVLHHTGNMWRALELIETRVKPGGRFFVALYNDQGFVSRAWRVVKRMYCRSAMGRAAVIATFFPVFFTATVLSGLGAGDPTRRFREYRRSRGMSIVHDWIDWLGGYPFEVARPEEVLDFFRRRNYFLQRMRTTNRMGCNEFVFVRDTRKS